MRYIVKKLKKLNDPRQLAKVKHPLYEILTLCILAVICGCTSSMQIYYFAVIREEILRKFLPLENGIPSRLTIDRTLRLLDPCVFEEWFNKIMVKAQKVTRGAIVALDGKRFFTERTAEGSTNPLYIVNAWCTKNNMVLAQQKTKEKSNEITAIPLLLRFLKIPGAIVTMDAMGCQKEIVGIIQKKNKADYCIALKENHPLMYKEMTTYAKDCLLDPSLSDKYTSITTTDKGHGRMEVRTYTYFHDLSWFHDLNKWEGLAGLVMVESKRTIHGITSVEVRYFITSLLDVESAATAIRSHWGIENRLHWVLDVTLREDYWQTEKQNTAANFATIRKLAFNLLRSFDPKLPINGELSNVLKIKSLSLVPKAFLRFLRSTNVFS